MKVVKTNTTSKYMSPRIKGGGGKGRMLYEDGDSRCMWSHFYIEAAFTWIERKTHFFSNDPENYDFTYKYCFYYILSGSGTMQCKGGEKVTLACRLHLAYAGGSESGFAGGDPWYIPYVDYALAHGIIASSFSDYSAAATRAQVAEIMSSAIPDSVLPVINRVELSNIPDVDTSIGGCDAILRFYRAGIITGYETNGTFYPNRQISRAETAAVVSRIADDTQRQKF
ncbi:MAG: S-layer homology domain-containing protein [Clostridia bacterium]|nr:S-layer homology domain-containing protein [Clostridia bacterium]